MKEIVKKDVTEFLRNNYVVMAYSLVDMKGVSGDVIKHRLNVKEKAKQVK